MRRRRFSLVSGWHHVANINKKDIWFYREIQRKIEKKYGKGRMSISFTARDFFGLKLDSCASIWVNFTMEMFEFYHEVVKEITNTRKPQYEHTYQYPCTFLGRYVGETGTEYDLYHTKTYQGYMFLFRRGSSLLAFDAMTSKECKMFKDDEEGMGGEAYRRALKKGLPLEEAVLTEA